MDERETLEVDVLIVGAGAAGLACAIRLMDEVEAHNKANPQGLREKPNVLVIEKGFQIGAHILSGCVMDPKALTELLPDWKNLNSPVTQEVKGEEIAWLSAGGKYDIPNFLVPPYLHNKGNYIVRLGEVAKWLGEQAKARGVEILEGLGGAKLVMENENDPAKLKVLGVQCTDTGLKKDGTPGENYLPGAKILAKVTVLAEGVRGSLAKVLIKAAKLDAGKTPQKYSTGVKEIWELPAGVFPAGKVVHTLGYPIQGLGAVFPGDPFGGSFLYGMDETHVALGLVIGLDYKDSLLDPHHEFQRLKTHPYMKQILEKGKIVAYGAKAIPEGGWHAMPKPYGNGFLMVGDTGGFLNAARLKGAHLAIKSGMLAGESIFEALGKNDTTHDALSVFDTKFQASWAASELKSVRDWRAGYESGLGLGTLHDFIARLSGGNGWVSPDKHGDHDAYRKVHARQPVRMVPDGKLTFDKMSDVYQSGTVHGETQPCHLIIENTDICVSKCTAEFGNPCQHFCPAGVYEFMKEQTGGRVQINAGNCVHCKTCDIKDPYENITWMVPEGGDGPRYQGL